MKPFHFLRIAAVFTLLYCAGHTSGMPWTPYTDPKATSVLEAMKSQSFEAEGFKGTYWDLYFGYGLMAVVFALFIAAALWLTSGLAGQPRQVLRFGACIGVAVVVHAAIVARYFFRLPLEFDLLVLAGIVTSMLLARRAPAAG